MFDSVISFYSGRMDRTLASIGVLIGVVFILLLRVVAPGYISLGAMLAIACAVYILLTNKKTAVWENGFTFDIGPRMYLVLNILFLIFLAFSFLMLYFSSTTRPIGYFISTALMGVILALEILTLPENSDRRVVIILAKVLMLGLILNWSPYYIFPGSFLGTDPWRNAVLYDSISESGHLVPEMFGYRYMPLHHLLVVTTAQITSLEIREAMILSVGLFEVFSLTFVFLAARNIFNPKVALLATLVLSINNLHIYWSWWIIAQTLGIALVAAVLFLIYAPRTQGNITYRAIVILTLFVLLGTHAVSSFVALVILLLSYLGSWIYTFITKTKVARNYSSIALLFGVVTISYWMYISSFFDGFVRMISSDASVLPSSKISSSKSS